MGLSIIDVAPANNEWSRRADFVPCRRQRAAHSER